MPRGRPRGSRNAPRELTADHPEQHNLLPTERIEPTLEWLDPRNIVIPTTTAPDWLVESMRSIGMLQPVAVVQGTGENYGIAAGRRRVRAARDIGMNPIPALVFPTGTPRHVAAAIALTENNQRRPNPLTDFVAIEAMMRTGVSEREIADQLHLPIGTIRARMRLGGLLAPMRRALETGRISTAVAEQIARLPPTRQEALEETLEANDRLTASDVRGVREARAAEQIDAMPDEMFVAGETAIDEPINQPQWGFSSRIGDWPIHEIPIPAQSTVVTLRPPQDGMQATIQINQGNERSAWYYADPIEFSADWDEDQLRELTGLQPITAPAPRRRRRTAAPQEVAVTLAEAVNHGWSGVQVALQAAMNAHPGDPDGGSEQIHELLVGAMELVTERVRAEREEA